MEGAKIAIGCLPFQTQKKKERCRSARNTNEWQRIDPKCKQAGLTTRKCYSVKCASPVRDWLISEGVGFPNKKADFVSVDPSDDSPVTEECFSGFVVSEVLSLGDHLHLEFPDLIQTDTVSREQPLDLDQFISELEIYSSSLGLPVDTNTAVFSNSCVTNDNTTLMASFNNKEDRTYEFRLHDHPAFFGGLSHCLGRGPAGSYKHHQCRCSSPERFETTSGWGNYHHTKTLCLPGNSDFRGHAKPCCYHEGWGMVVYSETGTIRIHNHN